MFQSRWSVGGRVQLDSGVRVTGTSVILLPNLPSHLTYLPSPPADQQYRPTRTRMEKKSSAYQSINPIYQHRLDHATATAAIDRNDNNDNSPHTPSHLHEVSSTHETVLLQRKHDSTLTSNHSSTSRREAKRSVKRIRRTSGP